MRRERPRRPPDLPAADAGDQQVGVNVQDQEEGPPGGARSVDEGAVDRRGVPGRPTAAASWLVLLIGLLFLAIPILWATGFLARLLPVAALLPTWSIWLIAAVAVATAALGLWFTYRFAARAP